MSAMLPPPDRLQVFFDGACPLCSREVSHYKKRDLHNKIEWIDIAQPTFNAASFGLDPVARQRSHARPFARWHSFQGSRRLRQSLGNAPARVLHDSTSLPAKNPGHDGPRQFHLPALGEKPLQTHRPLHSRILRTSHQTLIPPAFILVPTNLSQQDVSIPPHFWNH